MRNSRKGPRIIFEPVPVKVHAGRGATIVKMQVRVQPLFSKAEEENEVAIETNSQATVQSVISSFCAQKGITYSPRLALLDSAKRPLPSYSTLTSLGIADKQSLYISYTDKSTSLMQWPLIVALISLVIGVIGIIALSVSYNLSGGKVPLQYGIIMDAGSSKTKTLLYSWPGDKHKGTGCVQQVKACEVKGGIAKTYNKTMDEIRNCTYKIRSDISVTQYSETPVYFAATAGMRLLNLSDPTRVETILNDISSMLNETLLDVHDVSIISGSNEGIYGWTTANFLKHRLEDETFDDPWVPTTYGALDMGGASVQISFAIPSTAAKNESSLVKKVTLYGQTFYVFSQSNLCFGRDEANRRYRVLLAKNPTKTTINDPCSPKGYQLTMTGENLFFQPCTLPKDSAQLSENVKKTIYTFVGTSDYKKCSAAVSDLLNPQICSQKKFTECFEKIEMPLDVKQNYLAFATYFYTTNFLNATDISLEGFLNATKEYCELPYKEIPDVKYAEQYCFNARYIYEVLTTGYGFDNKTWKNLEFGDNIDGKDLGWSLGYMINATNIVPEKKPTRLLSTPALIVCLLIFIFAIIITALFLLHKLCKRNEKSNTSAQSLYRNA